MARDAPKAPQIAFIDNPTAPELFADEAVGFFVHGGVVRITFATATASHATSPGPVSRVVTARIAMTIDGAQGLALGLFDFLKARGLAPVVTASGGAPLKPN
jgi:hypothetical protein